MFDESLLDGTDEELASGKTNCSESLQEEDVMEPATIAVLAITAAAVGFCAWIEYHSRRQKLAEEPTQPVDNLAEFKEQTELRRRRRK
jgi:hypothetical protein